MYRVCIWITGVMFEYVEIYYTYVTLAQLRHRNWVEVLANKKAPCSFSSNQD